MEGTDPFRTLSARRATLRAQPRSPVLSPLGTKRHRRAQDLFVVRRLNACFPSALCKTVCSCGQRASRVILPDCRFFLSWLAKFCRLLLWRSDAMPDSAADRKSSHCRVGCIGRLRGSFRLGGSSPRGNDTGRKSQALPPIPPRASTAFLPEGRIRRPLANCARVPNDEDGDPLLGRIAEELTEKFKRGERPSTDGYVRRYPHLAEDRRVQEA